MIWLFELVLIIHNIGICLVNILFKSQAGSEVDKKNEDEQTPLHLAAKEGRIM